MKKLLILGHTGKMGTALQKAYADHHEILTANTAQFDAAQPEQVQAMVEKVRPDLLINAVAHIGIDLCEREPLRAFQVNTLFPKQLAELSRQQGFTLVHLSTDAVFSDAEPGQILTEASPPQPLNLYGLTKLGGERMVQTLAPHAYIFRVALLFGPTSKKHQFVEKMLARVQAGHTTLRIADDIFFSPSYSQDLADHMRRMTDEEAPFGLYHLTNQGQASLYDLMREICAHLAQPVTLEPTSHRTFPSLGVKNTRIPTGSHKIKALRPWQEAVRAYVQTLEAPCP